MLWLAQTSFDPTGLLTGVAGMTRDQFTQLIAFVILAAGLIFIYYRQRTILRQIDSAGKVAETKAGADKSRTDAEAQVDKTNAEILSKFTDIALGSQAMNNRLAEVHEGAIDKIVAAIEPLVNRVGTMQGVSQELILSVGENLAQQDIMQQYVLQESEATRKLVQNAVRKEFEPLLERAIAMDRNIAVLKELYTGSGEDQPGVNAILQNLDRRSTDMYDQILRLMEGKDVKNDDITQVRPGNPADDLYSPESDPVLPGNSSGSSGDSGSS